MKQYEWGNVLVTLANSTKSEDYVIITIETPTYVGSDSIQVYISKAGEVSVSDPDNDQYILLKEGEEE